MDRRDAENVLNQFVKSIYGFAVKKCRNAADAEDLAQDVMLKSYKALLLHNDIENYGKFIWTIAHNCLANYYKKQSQCCINLPIHTNICDTASEDPSNNVMHKEIIRALQEEIAHLSGVRRKTVIAYYYEKKSIKQIADKLNISVAMVKWHLFESKKSLKDGIENMRTAELHFNPVKFEVMGYSGSAGKMGGTAIFFRSALSQNIAFCVYRKNKTINQIADELGVSPVYVASEAEYLERYGYLVKKGNTYLANILIDGGEEASRLIELQENMYKEAAKTVATELYEKLIESGLLESIDIESYYKSDKNFLLWALLPYIVANSGDVEEKLSFEECATRREDGSCDIAYAVLQSDTKPQHEQSLKKWCGPAWISYSGNMLWGCRSEWSCERDMQKYISDDNLRLLLRIINNESLSVDQYASLAEQGFIRMVNGNAELCAVRLNGYKINSELLALGRAVRVRCSEQLYRLKQPYEKAVLDLTPTHLKKAQQYCLQYTFSADGLFLIYIISELLTQGKLKLPSPEQRASIMTVITPA